MFYYFIIYCSYHVNCSELSSANLSTPPELTANSAKSGSNSSSSSSSDNSEDGTSLVNNVQIDGHRAIHTNTTGNITEQYAAPQNSSTVFNVATTNSNNSNIISMNDSEQNSEYEYNSVTSLINSSSTDLSESRMYNDCQPLLRYVICINIHHYSLYVIVCVGLL